MGLGTQVTRTAPRNRLVSVPFCPEGPRARLCCCPEAQRVPHARHSASSVAFDTH